jgi:mono/diheme cytochrome c family protein
MPDMLTAVRQGLMWLLIALSVFVLAGCADRLAPAPVFVQATPEALTAAQLAPADLARGQQVYYDKQCGACHNPGATGGIGPALAGTPQQFDPFLHVLRSAVPPKPAFSEVELPVQDAYNVYGWLQSLRPVTLKAAAAPGPQLGQGQVLGMTLWVQGQCDICHGAFAQGSPTAPPLAGINAGQAAARDLMRHSAGKIPAHSSQNIDDNTFQRLYQWLKEGANPDNGC